MSTTEPLHPAPSGRPAAGRPGQVCFGAVLLLAAAGLAYLGVAPQHWLRGVLVVGAAMVLAGAFRLGLPDHRAGPLFVRGRRFDVAVYLLAGVAVAGFGVVLR